MNEKRKIMQGRNNQWWGERGTRKENRKRIFRGMTYDSMSQLFTPGWWLPRGTAFFGFSHFCPMRNGCQKLRKWPVPGEVWGVSQADPGSSWLLLGAWEIQGSGPGLDEEDQGKVMLIKLLPLWVRSLYWKEYWKMLPGSRGTVIIVFWC